jgi:GT2 family glycosyltransferase/glycosyltransferase involved in cell wall biosynthesis
MNNMVSARRSRKQRGPRSEAKIALNGEALPSDPDIEAGSSTITFALSIGDDGGAPSSGMTLVDLFFEETSYIGLYEDIKRQKDQNPNYDTKLHFTEYGRVEGRSPSYFFDTAYVAQSASKMDDIQVHASEALSYFEELPSERRFVPNRWFSARIFRILYIGRFPDLVDKSDYDLFAFFLANMVDERLSPNGLFNEAAYVSRYDDVAKAIEVGSERSGFLHYLTKGCLEERVNIPGFAGSGEHENSEERQLLLRLRPEFDPVVWWFDEEFYLSTNEDVHHMLRAGEIVSGLEHFLVVGFEQGRVPSPAAFRFLQSPTFVPPCGNGGWHWAEMMARRGVVTETISLEDATKLLAFLDPAPDRRAVVLSAIWKFVEPSVLAGTCDVGNYLALNPALERVFGSECTERADFHWRRHGVHEHWPFVGSNLYSSREVTLADVVNWKSGVNFFGPLTLASGLGSAARGYVDALRHAGIEVTTFDVSALFAEGLAAEIFCAEDLPYSINFFLLNADQVVPFTSKYGTEIFNHRANVCSWVWELPAPRIEWTVALSAFDLILVPTKFCAASFATITSRPIHVVPYAVQHDVLQRHLETPRSNRWLSFIEDEKAAGRKIVLFVMDASSYVVRKGLDLFVRLADQTELARPGECLFILKSHSKDLSSKLQLPANSHSFVVIDEVWDFAALCHLRAMADAYVSPHRSEGFGLNVFESIIMGVPTITSASAAITEHLGEDYPYLVKGRLSEVGDDMGPYHAGGIWLEPDPADLLAKLIAVVDGPVDPAFAATSSRLANDLSLKAISASLQQALQSHCALRPDAVDNFVSLAATRKDESYRLGFVKDDKRRIAGAPGLERLTDIAAAATQPFFSIITPAYESEPEWLEDLYEDLLNQDYLRWEWCVADDGSTREDTKATLHRLRRQDSRIKLVTLPANSGIAEATNAAVSISIGRYLIMIDHDDRVSPELLASYAQSIDEDGARSGILYCDEDKIGVDGARCDSYCKPDWSPEQILSSMYVLHCLCIQKQKFLELGGFRSEFEGAQDHDFVLRAAADHVPIKHVDRILYHWRISHTSAASSGATKTYALEAGRRAVSAYTSQIGVKATVEHGLAHGTFRVRPELPHDKVSLVILTALRGMARQSTTGSYAENFVRSILRHPPAVDFEIELVVDNDKADHAMCLRRIDPRIRIVPYAPPNDKFNFSHKANFAVNAARGNRVVLLNDDMQAPSDQWLLALLEMLELPGVGVAGGRLLYPDGKVQHGGIVLGVNGASTNIFGGLPPGHNGYNQYPHVIRNYSAVCGAMLAFRRSVFDLVGGFDTNYPVDYNDVDFCLRVQEAGLRVVYTPFAELIHFESRSAIRLRADGLDTRRFMHRWKSKVERDPFYNRNLSKTGTMCDDLIPLVDL